MIRVLVVDDSAFMRKALSMMLEGDPEIEVVDTARDGLEAVEKVKRLRPDLVTMDVEMPRMDGLTALRQIMDEAPCPVIMVSSLTREGAQATIEAMEAGAVDFIPKQSSFVSLEINKIRDDLIAKVKSIARSRFRLFRRGVPAAPAPRREEGGRLSMGHARLIAIGVSTGGPFALQQVIPALPADLPVPVAIVQHMPPHFTRSLAERLDGMSPLRVVEAEDGQAVEPGMVLIAPGGRHLVFRKQGLSVVARTPEEPTSVLHRPSVDIMFESACDVYRGRVLAVVMTGMGKDGLEGTRTIKKLGGRVVAQDEETCVVYGMPKAVVEAGLHDLVLPLERIGPVVAGAVAGASSTVSRAPAWRSGEQSSPGGWRPS